VGALAQDAVRGHLGIPSYRFGQLSKYKFSELEAWAAAHRKGAGHEAA
jgi:hypothetical protein